MASITQEEITRILKTHPLTKELVKSGEEREAIRQRRVIEGQKLKELELEKRTLLPRLLSEIEKKKREHEEATETAKRKQREFSDAEGLYITENHRICYEIEKIKGFLRQTGPSELKKRIEALRDAWEKTRKGNLETWFEGNSFDNIFSQPYQASNAKEIVKRMDDIQKEIRQIEARILEEEEHGN